MTENVMISVIVPVYNIIEYLPRCVESIKKQTYKTLEILLVDDGSTDGTGELCDRLGETDKRIKVIHKENGGSSSARNVGIKAAKGDYLGFVDSDDYIAPEMYEALLREIEHSHMPIAQAARKEIAETGEELPPICIPPKTAAICLSSDFMKELLLHKGDCSFCTKLIDRKLFEGHLFPEGVLNEDFYLLVQMLVEIEGIASIPPQMYYVFYRKGSNTRKVSKEEFSRVYGDCVENADMADRLVEEHYPQLKEAAMRFGLFQRIEYLLHIPISQMDKGNVQYTAIISYLRRHIRDGLCSHYLTGKNKVYIVLFAAAPKIVRKIHKRIKKI